MPIDKTLLHWSFLDSKSKPQKAKHFIYVLPKYFITLGKAIQYKAIQYKVIESWLERDHVKKRSC